MEAIKESISQMNQTFHLKLAEFEERQLKISSPSSVDAVSLAAEFSTFKTFVISALRTLQIQVELIARENDNLEMHNRRKVLLLHGIPEDNKSDIYAIIVETIVQKLKLSEFKAEDINRCQRMGRSLVAGKPRPILFKVRDQMVRSKIWAAKKNLKSSGITLSEFLTKPRHDALMLARQRFGVSRSWSFQGQVFVLDNSGVKHRVSCMAELDKLGVQEAAVASLKLPTVAVKEPAATGKQKRALKK